MQFGDGFEVQVELMDDPCLWRWEIRDPSRKIVTPVLYRSKEALACWRSVTAPVLWVEAAHSETPTRLALGADAIAERRAAFRDLRSVVVADAGHMLHHDQPKAVAALLERFLAR